MFSDSFKIAESADGVFYEVEGKVSHWILHRDGDQMV